MRSYWMSLSLVAAVLLGYTAIVFNSHSTVGGVVQPQQQTKSNPSEPREPATAAVSATTTAAEVVN